MKVIDCSPEQKEESRVSQLIKQAAEQLKLDFLLDMQAQAEERLIASLGRSLNNKYILIRNANLEGLEVPVPACLLGPTGVQVLVPYGEKGIYRAKNEQWLVMGGSQNFQPAKPNLVHRTILFTKALSAYLEKQGCQGLEVQGILACMNPGTHVDSVRPAIRIILFDGVERFASGLLQSPTILNNEDVQQLANIISEPPVPETQISTEQNLRLEVESPKPKILQSPLVQKMEAVAKSIHMTRKQVIFLGVMALFEVLILIAFILVILVTA